MATEAGKVGEQWTLEAGRWKGVNFCLLCNKPASATFCSTGCSAQYHEKISDPIKNTKPAFIHDCSECKFLGTYKDAREHVADLYVCIRPGGTRLDVSLIARSGDYFADYVSTLVPECCGEDAELFYRGSQDWYRTILCRAQDAGLV